MAKQTVNNIKLGLFVIVGLVLLVISLYLIGKNSSFFGSNIQLKARFHNVNGLVEGNNVRFSGIQAGTVKKINIIDDTTIEVTMQVKKSLKPFIHKNALANIGNEGLMGNKVINIIPNDEPAPVIDDNDLLTTKQRANTDEIFQTLSSTNNNLQDISHDLAITVRRINNSQGIWKLFNDTSISTYVNHSLKNIDNAAAQVNDMAKVLNNITIDMQHGKGTAGVLFSDEKSGTDLKTAISHINNASKEADELISKLNKLTEQTQNDLDHGHGIAHDILKDSLEAKKLKNSLSNIEKGTAAFSEDMEALKHNFLTRHYFKEERRKKKRKANSQDSQ